MRVMAVDDLVGGWFVGDFSPTTYKTTACEVAYKIHTRGEYVAPHYHQQADEINYLIDGSMSINGELLQAPVVFVIGKGEIASPTFHTDVSLVVVKVPGHLNDKFIVEDHKEQG